MELQRGPSVPLTLVIEIKQILHLDPNLQLTNFLLPTKTASNYLATTLSPTGTLSYSFTSEPTAAGVSYPYNATFGVGNYFTGATGRSIGPGVGNVIVVVTSTSGTPVTYVNPATTTVYPSGGSSMSTSASATHTGAAMGRFGVNAAAAVVGALVPAVMVL